MNQFPKWASERLSGSAKEQVSHGLNLVLELRDPLELPLMLWDIVIAQNKIKHALETLSFLHFARFVPSWDGRALMVTTEFDGPLEPYVLDFVIALGDVFDTLLSYVEEPPEKMPVREYPDEFVAWVRKKNRVPFLQATPGVDTFFPPPPAFDYPVYSAYPKSTVTDIVGPRQVMLPALDHPAAAVDPSDVQGNILRGYRAKHGRYLFYRVDAADLARTWLAQTLTDTARSWGGVADARDWVGEAPPVRTQVAFTHEGLKLLLAGSRQDHLENFPTDFKEGAAVRADANFDRGNSAPEHWLFGGPGQAVHVVVFVYTLTDPAPAVFDEAVEQLTAVPGSGLTHLMTMEGEANGGREWFGFADGISNPGISGQCPGREPTLQPTASPGEFLLHEHYASIYGGRSIGEMSPALARNGSFGVLRLMEQNVALFKSETEAEAQRLGIDVALLRAKLVGRWENGAPLSLFPSAAPPDNHPATGTNAFDYGPSWEFPAVAQDHEGLMCPVAAHIRRANPRSARVAGQAHSRRLLRRGMPSTWLDDKGTKRVGLMGLFLGASIERQFEFIQREWLHGSIAASGIRGSTDAIAAIRSEPTDFPFAVPDPACPHAPPVIRKARISPLVNTRGCLYLFFPGITALRELDQTPSLRERVEELKDDVQEGARAVVEKITDAVPAVLRVGAPTVAAAKEAVGGLFDTLKDLSKRAVHAAGQALHLGDSIPAAVASHLPGVDVSGFLGDVPTLDTLLDVPSLQDVADHRWKDIIRDLIEHKLDSPWFKSFLDAIAPSHDPVEPVSGVPQVDLNLTDPRLRAQPFEELKRLREAGHTLVWVKAQAAYWVLDYAGCQSLLNDKVGFLQSPPTGALRLPGGIVTLDEPRHTVVRAAYAEAFRAALARLEGQTVDGLPFIDAVANAVAKHLADQVDLRQFDYMSQFAHPLARAVVWHFIGVKDLEEQQACDALADRLVLHYGKPIHGAGLQRLVAGDAGLRLAARLVRHLAQAWLISSVPGNRYEGTLIGELAARMRPGFNVPHQRTLEFIETLLTVVQTVLASQSPHFLLGSAALHLMSPDPRPGKQGSTPWSELKVLKGAPLRARLSTALDEARRCEPPLALIERYASGTGTIGGVTLPRGSAVMAMVGSANRDKAKFGASSEDFFVDRAVAKDHLALGGGIHKCAGEALQARLVPAALAALIEALPELRLSNPTAQPAWRDTIYFRVLQALSVTRCPPPPESVAERVHGDPEVSKP